MRDPRELREMLRTLQAGEMTVSRAIELMECWQAGVYSDDMLPPVADDFLSDDQMPLEMIERLRADLETERMRLAACGVAALANTADSAARARDILPEYRSASLDDVERTVDREIQLRDERDAMAKAFLALHATVVGECPSLLDEDRGGSSLLIDLVADALERIEKERPE